MKEFRAQTGGRYTYADDLENIQDLALALTQIFDDCDNFIVSGCEVSGSTITAGYAFINGKLRRFSGATDIVSWPQYLYEVNTTENVPYESGGEKVGRYNYGCALKSGISVADSSDGVFPQYIIINSSGGTRLKDAFFGKYALLLNPTAQAQTVNSQVTVANQLIAKGQIKAENGICVYEKSSKTTLSYAGERFNLSTTTGDKDYMLTVGGDNGFGFYVNGSLAAKIDDSNITFYKSVSTPRAIIGAMALSGNNICQVSANDKASLNINVLGYDMTSSQYRDTHIGNGKGASVLSVFGESKTVSVSGKAVVDNGGACAITLKAGASKSNVSLTNAVVFSDSYGEIMASVGFVSGDDNDFYLQSLGNVNINGGQSVNIGPAIRENGKLLSEKYALASYVQSSFALKADKEDVYAKEEADIIFAKVGRGLSQFIQAPYTAAICRKHIGAVGSEELSDYAKISNCLSDVASSEDNKRRVRENIGAVGLGECEPKQTDTGWVKITDSLYARQVGKIVSIQGVILTPHSGTVFWIPNTIAPPSMPVKYTIALSNTRSWVCKIDPNQRACTVVYCDGSCGTYTDFSITYMI